MQAQADEVGRIESFTLGHLHPVNDLAQSRGSCPLLLGGGELRRIGESANDMGELPNLLQLTVGTVLLLAPVVESGFTCWVCAALL